MTDSSTQVASAQTQSAWAAWPLDREIVLTRVIDAPREDVFDAWTDPEQLGEWFGPSGPILTFASRLGRHFLRMLESEDH